jgi:hypothetical protein
VDLFIKIIKRNKLSMIKYVLGGINLYCSFLFLRVIIGNINWLASLIKVNILFNLQYIILILNTLSWNKSIPFSFIITNLVLLLAIFNSINFKIQLNKLIILMLCGQILCFFLFVTNNNNMLKLINYNKFLFLIKMILNKD